MLLQVHDELVFDVYKPELEIVKPIIEKIDARCLPLKVPVEVGMGVGVNWWRRIRVCLKSRFSLFFKYFEFLRDAPAGHTQ